MNQPIMLIVLMMAAAAVVARLASLYISRWRSSPGGIYFIGLMVADYVMKTRVVTDPD